MWKLCANVHKSYYLEKLIGKEKWDKFIPHYFTVWKEKSLDSYDFKATLLDFFASDATANKQLTDLDWDKWFYAPGFPPKPDFDTSMVDVCYALSTKWEALNSGKDKSFKPEAKDIEGWSANQSIVFLESIQQLSQPLSTDLVDVMGKAYAYASSHNVELVSRYYVIGLKAKDKSVYKPTAELLGGVGRMKFVRPLYKGLMACDEAFAKETFQKLKDFYHPICRDMVEKDLYGHGKGG